MKYRGLGLFAVLFVVFSSQNLQAEDSPIQQNRPSGSETKRLYFDKTSVENGNRAKTLQKLGEHFSSGICASLLSSLSKVATPIAFDISHEKGQGADVVRIDYNNLDAFQVGVGNYRERMQRGGFERLKRPVFTDEFLTGHEVRVAHFFRLEGKADQNLRANSVAEPAKYVIFQGVIIGPGSTGAYKDSILLVVTTGEMEGKIVEVPTRGYNKLFNDIAVHPKVSYKMQEQSEEYKIKFDKKRAGDILESRKTEIERRLKYSGFDKAEIDAYTQALADAVSKVKSLQELEKIFRVIEMVEYVEVDILKKALEEARVNLPEEIRISMNRDRSEFRDIFARFSAIAQTKAIRTYDFLTRILVKAQTHRHRRSQIIAGLESRRLEYVLRAGYEQSAVNMYVDVFRRFETHAVKARKIALEMNRMRDREQANPHALRADSMKSLVKRYNKHLRAMARGYRKYFALRTVLDKARDGDFGPEANSTGIRIARSLGWGKNFAKEQTDPELRLVTRPTVKEINALMELPVARRALAMNDFRSEAFSVPLRVATAVPFTQTVKSFVDQVITNAEIWVAKWNWKPATMTAGSFLSLVRFTAETFGRIFTDLYTRREMIVEVHDIMNSNASVKEKYQLFAGFSSRQDASIYYNTFYTMVETHDLWIAFRGIAEKENPNLLKRMISAENNAEANTSPVINPMVIDPPIDQALVATRLALAVAIVTDITLMNTTGQSFFIGPMTDMIQGVDPAMVETAREAIGQGSN